MDKGLNGSEMREERYQAIVAAYGVNPRNWPEAERASAVQFAAANPVAAQREEAALDALLGAYAAAQKPADDEAAMARILAGIPANSGNVLRFAPRRQAVRPQAKWFGERRLMAAGFALAALAGLAIGFTDGGIGLSSADASDELMVSYALAEG